MDTSSTSQQTKQNNEKRSTEKRLQAANKMANAVSRFYNKYMRGASDKVIEDELIEMKKALAAFWETGTKPKISREIKDNKNKGSTDSSTDPF